MKMFLCDLWIYLHKYFYECYCYKERSVFAFFNDGRSVVF